MRLDHKSQHKEHDQLAEPRESVEERKGLAFAGSDASMLGAYAVYILIAVLMTAFFSLKIFEHPCSDLMRLGAKISGR